MRLAYLVVQSLIFYFFLKICLMVIFLAEVLAWFQDEGRVCSANELFRIAQTGETLSNAD